jgi:ABC-type antimicrobial peptide transport system permease subunit
VQPILGRVPRDEDGENVVVISEQLWDTWFGRDPAVVGKSYFISGTMRQVIGVMPAEFRFPSDATLLWVASPIRLEQIQPGNLGIPVIVRMKPGVTHEQLAAELTVLAKQLPDRFGGTPNYARIIGGFQALVNPVLELLVGPTVTTSLWVLLGAVSIVLLIAFANVTNLFLVRVESRHRDLAVRRALGASRSDRVRLQIAEGVVIALLAGGIAVALSSVTLPNGTRCDEALSG